MYNNYSHKIMLVNIIKFIYVCAPPGNFFVVPHFDVRSLVLNPLSHSTATTRLLKQVVQSEELGLKQLQKSEALTSFMI